MSEDLNQYEWTIYKCRNDLFKSDEGIRNDIKKEFPER
jgi:hypothetical protein